MARCNFCGRSFSRNEHLIRHQRIHTGERPFHCPRCGAGFQRPDVLAKHVEKIHPQGSPSQGSRSQKVGEKTSQPRDRERSRLACDQCRKRKLKCDNVRPCKSCRSKLLDCIVSSSSRPPGRPRNTAPVSPTNLPIVDEHVTAGVDETINAVAGPPVFAPWTPESDEPTIHVGDLAQLPSPVLETTQADISSLRDGSHAHFETIGLSLPGVDEWMTSQPPHLPSVQAPFATDPMQLPRTCEAVDSLDDLVPSAGFGTWLDDLSEFSGFDDLWPRQCMPFDLDFDPAMESAIDMVKDQFQLRSRASSPSQAAQQRSWYSALPELGVYDEDIINVLLNVSRKNLSTTFALFVDFEMSHDTRAELCLAMAAVGALYCTVPDSTKVAKMLFNDSRRLLLEDYLHHADLSTDESFSFAKTFILLELYGLCSGDKRAYEFIEVFHGNKVHAATSCINALPSDPTASQRRQARLLCEAIQVLDSYRVLLLHRPPSFAGDSDVLGGLSNYRYLPSGGIISTSTPSSLADSPDAGMHHLATIIRYSWMASPQDANGFKLPFLWKGEFVELALDRWIQTKTLESDPVGPLDIPQMLLYHLTQVALHSNMAILQHVAQAAAQVTSRDDASDNTAQPWQSRHHFKIALWHAQAILRIAKDDMSRPGHRTTLEREKSHLIEPPHLPLCIYFATLVVWFGELRSSAGRDCLSGVSAEAGSRLLVRLKVPVSRILGKALSDLMSRDAC